MCQFISRLDWRKKQPIIISSLLTGPMRKLRRLLLNAMHLISRLVYYIEVYLLWGNTKKMSRIDDFFLEESIEVDKKGSPVLVDLIQN